MSGLSVPVHERTPSRVGGTSTINVGDINVNGNVEAPITIGNNNVVYNFSSNTEHGVVVNVEAPPPVRRRNINPQPPRTPRRFVGRTQELKDLEERIRGNEVVLLYGHDGIGKSTLLQKAANSDSAASMRDGVLYIEGNGKENVLGFQDILQYVFDAFYESNPPTKVTTSVAQVHLSNTRPLIILDNVGLPVNALNNLPNILSKGTLVVTSRAAQFDDDYLPIEISPLMHQDAIQLFTEASGVVSDSASLPVIDRICTLLEDTPLAITRIARFIQQKRLTLASTVEKLETINPPSQNKIQAAIERSFGLIYTVLNPEEREMLAATAAAPGLSVDRPWLESVAGGEETSKELESLELLQANSPRLRLHDGIKQILQSGRIDFRGRLLEHYISELPIRSLDFGYVSGELGNILGLIQWASSEGRWTHVVALGRAVDPYLTAKGLWDAWENVLNQVLMAGEYLRDQATQAWALHQLGSREIGMGSIPRAVQLLIRALKIRETIGDGTGAAFTRHNLNLILPPPPDDDHDTDQKEPSDGNGTHPPSDRGWFDRFRYWLSMNPGWIIPILFGAFIIIALAGLLLSGLFNNQLELTVQAERLIYMDPSNNAIHYTYSIQNKTDLPLAGSMLVTSRTIDSIDCPGIDSIGNFDNLLDPGETITCDATYRITPTDLERGSIIDRAQAQMTDRGRSRWISTTTSLEPGKPEISLSISPDTTSYEHIGQEIKYIYTITNMGNIYLRNHVEINDNKMEVFCEQPVTTDAVEADYIPPNGTLTCTGIYSITQPDLDNEAMANAATATVDGIRSNEAVAMIRAKVFNGLELTTTAEPEHYEKAGQTIRFKHVLVNKGNVTLKSLPTINNDLSSDPCTVMAVDVPESLVPETQLECISIYTVTQEDVDNGSLTNHAIARIGDVTSNESVTTINAIQNPALETTITASPTSFGHTGETISYTVTITNRGNVTLGSIQLSNEQYEINQQLNCDMNNNLVPEVSLICTATYLTTVADIDAKEIASTLIASAPFHEEVIKSSPASSIIPFVCPGPPSGWQPYTVRPGNSLMQISAAYNLAPSVFQEANCMGSSMTIYAGQRFYVPYLVTIEGLVFYDTNKDGSSVGEKGIPDFNVTLKYGNVDIVATTTTNANGNYTFLNLIPGDYWVLDAPVEFKTQTYGVRNFGLVPVP